MRPMRCGSCSASLSSLFRPTSHYSNPEKRHTGAAGDHVHGALVGSKIAVLFGDALWPLKPMTDWSALIWSGGRSSAPCAGFIVAESCKPLMNYRLPPNDRFAVSLLSRSRPAALDSGSQAVAWACRCAAGSPWSPPTACHATPRTGRSRVQLLCGIGMMLMWRRKMLAAPLRALPDRLWPLPLCHRRASRHGQDLCGLFRLSMDLPGDDRRRRHGAVPAPRQCVIVASARSGRDLMRQGGGDRPSREAADAQTGRNA